MRVSVRLGGAQRGAHLHTLVVGCLPHCRLIVRHCIAPFSQQHTGNKHTDPSATGKATGVSASLDTTASNSSSSSQRLRQRFQSRGSRSAAAAAAANTLEEDDVSASAAAAATFASAHASRTVTVAPVPAASSSEPSSSSSFSSSSLPTPPSAISSSLHRHQSIADQAAAQDARLLQELGFSLHDDERDHRFADPDDWTLADDAFDFLEHERRGQHRRRQRGEHLSHHHHHNHRRHQSQRDAWRSNSYERHPLRDEPFDELYAASGTPVGPFSLAEPSGSFSSEEAQAAALQQLERELALVEHTHVDHSKSDSRDVTGGASLHVMQLRRLATAARQVLQVVSHQSTQLASLQAALQQSEDTVRVLARQFTPQHVNRELQAAGKAPRSSGKERARAMAEAAAMERALATLTEPTMRTRVLAALQSAGYGPSTAPWLLPFDFLRRLVLISARECTPQHMEQLVAFLGAVQTARPTDLSIYDEIVYNEDDAEGSISRRNNPVADLFAARDAAAAAAAATAGGGALHGHGDEGSQVLTASIIDRMFVLLVWQQSSRQLTRSFWQIGLVLLFQSLRLIGPASASWRPSAFVYDVLLYATLHTQQHRQEMDVASQAVEHAMRRSVLAEAQVQANESTTTTTTTAPSPPAASMPNVPAPAFIEHALWQWSDSAYGVPITPAQALQILFACLPSLQPAHALLFWQHCVEVRAVSQQLAQALGTFIASHLAKLVNLRESTRRTSMVASATSMVSPSAPARRLTPLDDAIHTNASVLVTLLSDWAALELERDVHPDALGLLSNNSSALALERWTNPKGHTHWLDARSARVRQVVHAAGETNATAAAATANDGLGIESGGVHIPELDEFKPSGAAWVGWTLMRRNRFSAHQVSTGMVPQHSFSVSLREQLFPLPSGTSPSISLSFFSGLISSSTPGVTSSIDPALRAVHEDIVAAGLEQPASASPHVDPFWDASRDSSHSEDGASRSVAQTRSAAKARLAQHIQRKFMRPALTAESMRVDSLPLPSAYPRLHRQ